MSIRQQRAEVLVGAHELALHQVHQRHLLQVRVGGGGGGLERHQQHQVKLAAKDALRIARPLPRHEAAQRRLAAAARALDAQPKHAQVRLDELGKVEHRLHNWLLRLLVVMDHAVFVQVKRRRHKALKLDALRQVELRVEIDALQRQRHGASGNVVHRLVCLVARALLLQRRQLAANLAHDCLGAKQLVHARAHNVAQLGALQMRKKGVQLRQRVHQHRHHHAVVDAQRPVARNLHRARQRLECVVGVEHLALELLGEDVVVRRKLAAAHLLVRQLHHFAVVFQPRQRQAVGGQNHFQRRAQHLKGLLEARVRVLIHTLARHDAAVHVQLVARLRRIGRHGQNRV